MSWKHDADREAQQSGEYVESSFNVRYLTIEVASLARAGLDTISTSFLAVQTGQHPSGSLHY